MSKVVYGGYTADTSLKEAAVYAFVILVGLALGLGVAMGILDELVPVKAPKALTRTVGALLAMGAAWALDYSVFTAFNQPIRETWMHHVATGIVLVGVADVVREVSSYISGLSRKTQDEAVEIERRIPRAA